jgi:hypothetical protein
VFVLKIWRSRRKDKPLGIGIFIIPLKTVSAECLFGFFHARIRYLIEDTGAVMDKINCTGLGLGIFFDERPILLQEFDDFEPEIPAGNADFP